MSDKKVSWPTEKDYLDIYNLANANARHLLGEAELLFAHEHFARAYAIAFTALEEISKGQFAADIFTGLIKPEKFKSFYKNHFKKLRNVTWAHIDANPYPHKYRWIGPDIDDLEEIRPKKPDFLKRMKSLYVDIDFINKKITEPKKLITADDAKEMIRIVEVALQRIWEITGEFGGMQIGTKGFMK